MTSTDLVPACQTASTDLVRTEDPAVDWRRVADLILRATSLAVLIVALLLAGAVAFMVAAQ